MNRLTERGKSGIAYTKIPLNNSTALDENENIIECYTGFIAEKLAEYEDLEEQGLLIKLPCKVGDVVYLLGGKDYNKFRVGCVDWKSGMEYKGKNYQLYMEDNYYDKAYINFSDIGKTVFLTREEAEKVLKEMEGKQ